MSKNPVKEKIQPLKTRFRKSARFFTHPPVLIAAISIALIIILISVLAIGLENIYSGIKSYNNTLDSLAASYSTINKELDARTARLSSAELLLNNTNRILSTVYFGTADLGEKEEARDFTAFTILFNERFYLVTAGHCIEFEGEKYSNFKFKANNKARWVYPELIAFENDYKNKRDYAIFYSAHLFSMGLIPASTGEDLIPQYVLGNTEKDLNLVKRYSDAIHGESGSPVLNKNCHVIGLIITSKGDFTPVSTILEALGKVESNLK